MTTYSQRDIRWRWKKLGYTRLTIGSYGCLVTCFGMLANKRPDTVNDLFKTKGGLNSSGLVVWATASNLLGLKWLGKSAAPKGYPTIAEVIASGTQHFVIWLGNNQIIDPWDGKQKTNPYKVRQFASVLAPAPAVVVPPKQFTVRVDKAVAAVRVQPTSKSALSGSRYLYRGDRFKATGTVVGESVLGNNVWYKSAKGNYVWSGGLTKV